MADANHKASRAKARALGLGSALVAGTVFLEAGPDRRRYDVHKALLVHHSGYFRNALKGPWKEAEEGVLTLEDVEPLAVNIFVHWLYINQLPDPFDDEAWVDILGKVVMDHVVVKIQAYAFADRFLTPNFLRAINNNIIDDIAASSPLDISSIQPMIERLSAGSLRIGHCCNISPTSIASTGGLAARTTQWCSRNFRMSSHNAR